MVVPGPGDFRLGPLVPGRYTIRAQHGGESIEHALELTGSGPAPTLELAFE